MSATGIIIPCHSNHAQEFPEHSVGMNTIIIIGNGTSFTSDGRMVTPRGYGRKYQLEETL